MLSSAEPFPHFHAHNPFPFNKTRTRMNAGPDEHHEMEQQEMEHIWLVTGPAGCGKSTVAEYLAKKLSLPFVEGDDVRDDVVTSRRQVWMSC